MCLLWSCLLCQPARVRVLLLLGDAACVGWVDLEEGMMVSMLLVCLLSGYYGYAYTVGWVNRDGRQGGYFTYQ